MTLQIKEDIAAANAFSTNKSAAFLEDIYLYGSEVDITPRVYGIRRADNSGLPLTSGAANVIITLSEMPQAFTAAEIDVMNGTAGTPVALGPIRQNAVGLSQFATHIEMPEVRVATLTQIRDGIFKVKDGAREDGSARDEFNLKGIEYYVSVVANERVVRQQIAMTRLLLLPLITPPRSRGMTRQGRNTVPRSWLWKRHLAQTQIQTSITTGSRITRYKRLSLSMGTLMTPC